ncbi:hypothetical protein PFISCL1PPCAC_7225, partial [Pristionchus fissidentatus]
MPVGHKIAYFHSFDFISVWTLREGMKTFSMLEKVGFLCESELAQIAFERSLSRMSTLTDFQVVCLGEYGVTLVALERIGVCLLVGLQFPSCRELLFAEGAREIIRTRGRAFSGRASCRSAVICAAKSRRWSVDRGIDGRRCILVVRSFCLREQVTISRVEGRSSFLLFLPGISDLQGRIVDSFIVRIDAFSLYRSRVEQRLFGFEQLLESCICSEDASRLLHSL